MDRKVLVAILAVLAVVIAAAAAVVIFNGDDHDDEDKDILIIKAPGEYTSGTYKKVIIDPSVGDGTVTLDGVVISGDLVVNGGGSHSIILKRCSVEGKTVVEKMGGEAPRILAEHTNLKEIIANSDIIVEADAESQISSVVSEGNSVTVQGASTFIDNLQITNGSVSVTDGAKVSDLSVSGNVELELANGSTQAITVQGETVITGEISDAQIFASDSNSVPSVTVNGQSQHVHSLGTRHEYIAPGCETPGQIEYFECADPECHVLMDANFGIHSDIVIPPKGHDYGTLQRETPATCTEDGEKEHYVCGGCQKLFFLEGNSYVETTPESLVIEALGHVDPLQHVASKPATCEESGNVEYYYCSQCQQYFSDAAATDMLFAEEVFQDALGHSHNANSMHEYVAPGCETPGQKMYYDCENGCGSHLDANNGIIEEIVIAPEGHDYGTLQRETPASCIENGEKEHYVCGGCQKIFFLDGNSYVETTPESLVIPATGHRLNHMEHQGPTCLDYGTVEYYFCELCQMHFSDAKCTNLLSPNGLYLPPLGHDWVFTLVPVDEHGGNVTAVCNRDHSHDILENPVPAQGYPKEGTGPTCTESGKQTWILSFGIDGETFTGVEVETAMMEATGHDWNVVFIWSNDRSSARFVATCCNNSEHKVSGDAAVTDSSTEPTCTEPGVVGKTATATVGNETFTDSIGDIKKPLGHIWTETVYTWTETDGVFTCSATHSCTRDGCDVTEQESAVITSQVTLKPTCENDGKTTFVASFDKFPSDKKEVTVSAPGHSYRNVDAKAATCTEIGWDVYQICDECGKSTYVEKPATGHKLTEWAVTKEPSKSSPGSKERHCIRCDYSEEEIVLYVDDGKFLVSVTSNGYVTVKGAEVNKAQTSVRVESGTEVIVSFDGECDGFLFWMDSCGGYPAGESFSVLVDRDCYFTPHDSAQDYVFTNWTTMLEPTCTEPGYKVRTGSIDGIVLITDYWEIPALGHELIEGSYVEDVSATCLKSGYGHTTCSVCKEHVFTVLEATGHTYGDFEVLEPANGSKVGTLVAHCLGDGCDETITRDYISAVTPEGNIKVVYDGRKGSIGWEDHTNTLAHDEWHISYKGEDGKQTYLYYVFRDVTRQLEGEVHTFIYYVDNGPHSPVYVTRTSGTSYNFITNWAYKDNQLNQAWGIMDYVDSYEDFVKFLGSFTTGHMGSTNNSSLFQLYHSFEREFNKYGWEHFVKKAETTIAGAHVTEYWDISERYSYCVDDNFCTLRLTELDYNGYVEEITSLESIDVNGIDYLKDVAYVNDIPAKENVFHYAINMDLLTGADAGFSDDDSTHYIGNYHYGYYCVNNIDRAIEMVVHLYEHQYLVSWEVRDLDGNWVPFKTTYNPDCIMHKTAGGCYLPAYGNQSIRALYAAMAQAGTGRFAEVGTPDFDEIYLRAITAYYEPNNKVTVINGCIEGYEGVTEKQFYNDDSTYVAILDGDYRDKVTWTMKIDGETVDLGEDAFYRYLDFSIPAEGDHEILVEATVAPFDKGSYEIRVECSEGGRICSFDSDFKFPLPGTFHAPMDSSFEFYAEAYPGFMFYGWFLESDRSAYDHEEEFEPMALDLFDEYGEPSSYYDDFSIYVDGNITLRAIFVPISIDEMCVLEVINGFGVTSVENEYDFEGGTRYLFNSLSLSSQFVLPGTAVRVISNPNYGEAAYWKISDCYGDNIREADVGHGYWLDVYRDTVATCLLESDIKKYTVTYDNSDSDSGSFDSVTVTEFAPEIRTQYCDFTKFGYYYTSWIDQFGNTYSGGQRITLDKDLVLSPNWQKSAQRVTFNVVLPDGEPPSKLYYVDKSVNTRFYIGETYEIPQVLTHLWGYELKEWNTKRDGTGIPYQTGDEVEYTGSSLVLYSVLIPKTYTIHFNNNREDAVGGFSDLVFTAPLTSSSSTIGRSVTLEGEMPTVDYYQAHRWYATAAITNNDIIMFMYEGGTFSFRYPSFFEVADSVYQSTEVTMYALWEPIQYRVVYCVASTGNETGSSGNFTMCDDWFTTNSYNPNGSAGWRFDRNSAEADFGFGVKIRPSQLVDHADENNVIRLYR